MAETKSRRISLPWWVWLFAPALALLIAIVALPLRRDTHLSGEANPIAGEMEEAPIRDIAVLLLTDQPTRFVGSSLAAHCVILGLTGQNAFWVEDGNAGRVLISEGPKIDSTSLRRGQIVGIYGKVKQLPSWDVAQRRWGLDAKYKSDLDNKRIYIQASHLRIDERPAGY